jgi:hypothetical protein
LEAAQETAARAEQDAEDKLLLDLANCKSTSSVRFKQCRSKVLKRALQKSHPILYLSKYTGPRSTQLLKDFKRLQQDQQLANHKKAEKKRQENIEEEIFETAYLANNEHKLESNQQDDGLDMDGLMEYPVPEDLNLSADTVKEPDDASATAAHLSGGHQASGQI